MHFFIDHTKLPVQAAADAYGPDSASPSVKFNCTSSFQLTEKAKAFACQDSMMIVQQSAVDPSLVNVILKPIEGLKISFTPVTYYVYRGILKTSFINGSAIVPQTDANRTEFINRFWTAWNQFKADNALPSLPDPTPKVLGYDTALADATDVLNVFDHSQTAKPVLIKEGEWFGEFSGTFKSGFEVIVNNETPVTLQYVRAAKYVVDTTSLAGLALKAEREKILSYIDPAAFWGMHFYNGLKISTYSGTAKTTVSKKGTEIVTLFLNKYATKNRVYVDIRSEKGYSYNFYNNYQDAGGNHLKLGNSGTTPVAIPYAFNSWPLVVIDAPMATSNAYNDVKVNLRVNDNSKPILFFEDRSLLGPDNRDCFVREPALLNGSATDWTKEQMFRFPNNGSGASKDNIAYHIRLQYFRQQYNASSPATVMKNEHYYESLVCPVDLRTQANDSYPFKQVTNNNYAYISGSLPNTSSAFGYVAQTGSMWDTGRITFYARSVFENKNTGLFHQPVPNGAKAGIKLAGSMQGISMLRNAVGVLQQTVQEAIGGGAYQETGVLDITHYNGSPAAVESMLMLGITRDEFNTLRNVSGFTDKHYRYILLEEVSGSPFTDINSKVFRKYKLKVQGHDGNGQRLIQAPSTDVHVYTQNGKAFTSKNFAAAEAAADPVTYSRNYEESIGAKDMPGSDKIVEDFFIEKDAGMKQLVDAFKEQLGLITTGNTNVRERIAALVRGSAPAIFQRAVTYVQTDLNSSNPHPDDRPLYWARLKMEVMLKEHAFFTAATLGDRIAIEQIFEEMSRNYTGVNFSAAPANAKKILITGYDPFFLNSFVNSGDNVLQSNPSGAVALALHGTTTANGKGYIQSMIVPVRYKDFDSSDETDSGQGLGIIEKYIQPWINNVDMIITLSQALPGQYNIDRYATATRGGTRDNMNHTRPALSRSVFISLNDEKDIKNEWIITTLPSQFIQSPVVLYARYKNAAGQFKDGNISGQEPVEGQQMKEGPGGDYLSNEIFYRVAKLRKALKDTLPTGHFHVAMIQTGGDFSPAETKNLINIVKTAINNGVTGI